MPEVSAEARRLAKAGSATGGSAAVQAETRTPGFCALCKSRCGAMMVTRAGRLVGQEPLPSHPTGAALCVKGRAAPEIIYSEARQLHPLKRTKPKGDPDPGWQRISWDEALETVAAALARLKSEGGAESVAFGSTTPSGTPIADNIDWIVRFINAYGSPNAAVGTEICNWHKDVAHAYTFGRSIASPDFSKSGCVVLWGHNPSATWLDHATATAAAKARGAKLIVVDPRRVGFAARADHWLRVRPGADGLLALGLASEMIRNGWFDRDFVRDWSNGPLLVREDTNRFLRAGDLRDPIGNADADDLVSMDERSGSLLAYALDLKHYRGGGVPALEGDVGVTLADGATMRCRTAFALYRELCEAYPPERVEALAWVPAADVTATARALHEARPVSYYAWAGVGQHTNATQTDRAIATLMALTGSFDAPGGNVEFTLPPTANMAGRDLIAPEQRAKCIDLARSGLGPGRNGWTGSDALYDAILDEKPYAIRGLVNFGRNFLVTHADGERGAKALAKLDFYVHLDLTLTPTASHADIFLPVNTPWERQALRIGFEGSQEAANLVQLRQAVADPVGESRSDAAVVFDLAGRLGFGDLFFDGDVEAGLRATLVPSGISLEALRDQPGGIRFDGTPHYFRYREKGFATRSGKVELFSEVLRDGGEDPLPRFVEPASSPFRPGASAFPLVLTSAKIVQYCHSQYRQIPSLRRRAADPEVSLHPATAAERGIADGDWVELRTDNGMARMRARFDGGLDPRVISAQYGWWENGANFGPLATDRVADPISGSTGLKSQLCEVAPAGNEAGSGWAGWRRFRIVERRFEARDIVSLELSPSDDRPLAAFPGGQYVTLRIEGEAPLVRCYSLSRHSIEGGRYRISVKLDRREDGAAGAMSGRLHTADEALEISLLPPKGSFILDASTLRQDLPLIFAGGGIGITPLLSMLHELRGRAWRGPIHLLHGARSGADHAFADELAELRRGLPGLQITTFYSRPTWEDRRLGRFDEEGRVEASVILAAAHPLSPIYLCGPSSMIATVTAGLQKAGVEAGRVHLEAFGPSSREPVVADAVEQPVTLARSGLVLTWKPDGGSLLDQIARTGVALPSGCRTGQCETCAVPLRSGTVAYPAGMSESEGDRCLACVAIPTSPLVLDV